MKHHSVVYSNKLLENMVWAEKLHHKDERNVNVKTGILKCTSRCFCVSDIFLVFYLKKGHRFLNKCF